MERLPFTSPVLNDSGTMVFFARLVPVGEEEGIFTFSGGPITTIADSSGPFNGFRQPSLNNSGTVAFLGSLDTGESGIFTGPDPSADEVIGTGDPLFGSTVAQFFMDRESLNDSGQIAFYYELADGRIGVARADPLVTPVPEPGTLFLLVAGLLAAVLWRKGEST